VHCLCAAGTLCWWAMPLWPWPACLCVGPPLPPPPPRAPPYMCLSWGEGPPMSVCRGMSRRGTVSSGTAMK
jgi:hypothetical protein